MLRAKRTETWGWGGACGRGGGGINGVGLLPPWFKLGHRRIQTNLEQGGVGIQIFARTTKMVAFSLV